MKVWVTRDNDETGDVCGWNDIKNIKMNSSGFWDGGLHNTKQLIPWLENLSPKQFKTRFGFTPRKGSCKQMNLSLTEIT